MCPQDVPLFNERNAVIVDSGLVRWVPSSGAGTSSESSEYDRPWTDVSARPAVVCGVQVLRFSAIACSHLSLLSFGFLEHRVSSQALHIAPREPYELVFPMQRGSLSHPLERAAEHLSRIIEYALVVEMGLRRAEFEVSVCVLLLPALPFFPSCPLATRIEEAH